MGVEVGPELRPRQHGLVRRCGEEANGRVHGHVGSRLEHGDRREGRGHEKGGSYSRITFQGNLSRLPATQKVCAWAWTLGCSVILNSCDPSSTDCVFLSVAAWENLAGEIATWPRVDPPVGCL